MSENQRYLSLDVFRGMTVCFMIIVNTGGGPINYAPLLHASWHGFTPTDLVFPSFLFAVGNAMAFSLHKYELQGEGVFWRKTLKRTAIIFLLGFLMYWFPFFRPDESGEWAFKSITTTRILGVLQRIAVCVAVVGLLAIHTRARTQWAVLGGLLLGYAALLLGADTLAPWLNPVSRVDTALFAPFLYKYDAVTRLGHDPEGLLSTTGALATTLLGLIAGRWLRA